MKLLCSDCINEYSKDDFVYCKIPVGERWEKFQDDIMISCTGYARKKKKVVHLTADEQNKKDLLFKIRTTLFRKDSEDYSCRYPDSQPSEVIFDELTGDTSFNFRGKKYTLKLEEEISDVS